MTTVPEFLALDTLNDATVGQSFATNLVPSGGAPPYSWAVAGGSSLPPGLTLVSGSALRTTDTPGATLLAGAPSTAGQYTFDLIVTDANAATLRRTFTLNVSAMSIISGFIRTPTVGSAYNEAFTAVGGTGPYTFTMTPSSLVVDMLPPGLTFSSSGIISGTPTSGGSFGFILKGQDSAGHSYARTYSYNASSSTGLFIGGNNPSDDPVGGGRLLNLSLQTTGTAIGGAQTFHWTVQSGALPPGISLISTDSVGPNGFIQIGGQPTVPGNYTFTLRAADAGNASNFFERVYTVHIASFQIVPPTLAFLAPSNQLRALPGGVVGAPYSFALKEAGGTAPFTFAMVPFSFLPPGLSLSSAGVLSGTPTTSGTFTLVFTVQD
jgi:hypothetical protein